MIHIRSTRWWFVNVVLTDCCSAPKLPKKSPNSVWMLQRNILKQVSRCFECILLIVTVKIIQAYKSTRVFYFVVFTLLTASSTHQINISPLVRLIVIRINSLRWLCPVKICQKYIWMLACHEILSPEEGNCFSGLKVTSSESTFVCRISVQAFGWNEQKSINLMPGRDV